MRIQIHTHARPVQARRHLLDMRRFAGTVQALQKHAAIARKARKQGECHVVIEAVHRINFRHMCVAFCKGGHTQIGVEAEHVAHGDDALGLLQRSRCHERATLKKN